MHVHIYIYTHIHMYMHIYLYILTNKQIQIIAYTETEGGRSARLHLLHQDLRPPRLGVGGFEVEPQLVCTSPPVLSIYIYIVLYGIVWYSMV